MGSSSVAQRLHAEEGQPEAITVGDDDFPAVFAGPGTISVGRTLLTNGSSWKGPSRSERPFFRGEVPVTQGVALVRWGGRAVFLQLPAGAEPRQTPSGHLPLQ